MATDILQKKMQDIVEICEKINASARLVEELITFKRIFQAQILGLVGGKQERIEIIIAIVWIFGILVKITLCLFAALKGLQHITRHESYNPFLFPEHYQQSAQLHPVKRV